MVEEFKESEGWMPVETDDEGRWTPKKMGDSIKGIYLTKKTSVGQYNSIVYVIKNEDGEFDVMGTTGLNNAFKKIQVGYEVAIIFKGEKPLKPPKNPYKIFKVYARKPGVKGDKTPEAPQMVGKEDPEAERIIEMLEEEISAKHKGNGKPSLEEIVDLAAEYSEDPVEVEIDSKMLKRIKVVLANRE